MKKSKRNNKKQKKRRFLVNILVLFLAFAGSTGASYYYFKDMFAFESSFISDIESRQSLSSKRVIASGDRRLYGSVNGENANNDGTVFRKDTVLIVAEDIIRKALEQYKVRLLDLYMDRNGVIYMDLGSELMKNFRGDAYEEMSLVAGMFRGLNAAVPGFTALKILIQGRETESFGGHIDISGFIGGEIAGNI